MVLLGPILTGVEGVITADWELARALEVGDKATGVSVLVPLYEKNRAAPVETDLPALWKQLGVEVRGGKVVFDDKAPLAATRRAIGSGR